MAGFVRNLVRILMLGARMNMVSVLGGVSFAMAGIVENMIGIGKLYEAKKRLVQIKKLKKGETRETGHHLSFQPI